MKVPVYLLVTGSPFEAPMAAARTDASLPPPVRWTTTVDDLVDGSHLTAVVLRRVVSLVGIAALAGGAVTIASSDTVFGLFLVAYGVLDLGIIYARPLERWILARQAKHLVGVRCEASLTEEGVQIGQGEAMGTVPWDSMTAVREDERTLLLVAGKAARFGIPKRVFASPAAADAFRDAVIARIGTQPSAAAP